MASRLSRILILCKTYPSPSGKHVETSCVAGMEENGKLIRLFPVPFRLVGDEKQFKKWQWIKVRIEQAPNDRRPESHKIFVDTIACEGDPLSTRKRWEARREQINKIATFEDFAALEANRVSNGQTLSLLRPLKIIGLDITQADRSDWTEEEREKLIQHQRQGGLFDDTDAKQLATLRKVPFDFHYRYACSVNGQEYEYRHKIADWEAGALYWTCRAKYRDAWEKPFRAKLEEALPAADLMFLMGTIHRFPNQWLIVSLIYPPKLPSEPSHQGTLFCL